MPKPRALIIEEVHGGFIVTAHDGGTSLNRAVAATVEDVLVQVRRAFKPANPDPPVIIGGGGGATYGVGATLVVGQEFAGGGVVARGGGCSIPSR